MTQIPELTMDDIYPEGYTPGVPYNAPGPSVPSMPHAKGAMAERSKKIRLEVMMYDAVHDAVQETAHTAYNVITHDTKVVANVIGQGAQAIGHMTMDLGSGTYRLVQRSAIAVGREIERDAKITARTLENILLLQDPQLGTILLPSFLRQYRLSKVNQQLQEQSKGKQIILPFPRANEDSLENSIYYPPVITSPRSTLAIPITTQHYKRIQQTFAKAAVATIGIITAINLGNYTYDKIESLRKSMQQTSTISSTNTPATSTATNIPIMPIPTSISTVKPTAKYNIPQITTYNLSRTHLDTLADQIEMTLSEPTTRISPYADHAKQFYPIIDKYLREHIARYNFQISEKDFEKISAIEKGLIEKESSWITTATSNKGAIGLTQIMYSTAKAREKDNLKLNPKHKHRLKSKKDLYTPDNNIYYGTQETIRLIASAYETHNDLNKAIIDSSISYIGGEGLRDQLLPFLMQKKPLPPVTNGIIKNYTKKIISYAATHKNG